MTRYRRIESRTRIDRRFRRLSAPPPNAQDLWIELLTGEATTIFPGLVITGEESLARSLRWPLMPDVLAPRPPNGCRCLRDAWREIAAEGMGVADWEAGVIVLPKALINSAGYPRDTAKPGSPNNFRGWAKSWQEIPECDISDWYLDELQRFARALDREMRERTPQSRKTPYADVYEELFDHLGSTSKRPRFDLEGQVAIGIPVSSSRGPSSRLQKSEHIDNDDQEFERARRSGDASPNESGTRPPTSRFPARAVPDPDPALVGGDLLSGSGPLRSLPDLQVPPDRGTGASSLHEPAASPLSRASSSGAPAQDPAADLRRRLVVEFAQRINAARAKLAAKLKVQLRPIPIGGGLGETALIARLKASADPAGDMDHVIRVAELEAAAGETKWFSWSLAEERPWRIRLAAKLPILRGELPRPLAHDTLSAIEAAMTPEDFAELAELARRVSVNADAAAAAEAARGAAAR